MLVNWKNPRLLKAGSSIENNALVLKPGVNDVDPVTWAHAIKTPLFKHYLNEGELEVVEQTAGKTKVDDLSGVNEGAAKKLITDTNDELLLMKWHEAEKRAGVQKAIEAKLEVLAKAGGEKKGEDK